MNLLAHTIASSIFLLVFSTPVALGAEPGKVVGGMNFETPNWFKTSFLEIAEDAQEAGESGKHLLLFFHLNGCPYCTATVNDQFKQEPIKSFMQAHFDSIEINIKGDREIAMTADFTTTERELAEHLKIEHTPAILMLNRENETVLRLNGFRSTPALKLALEYVQQNAYLESSFSDYKRRQMRFGQYRFIANPMIETVTDFSAISEPVLLIIEDDDCNECSTFHTRLINRQPIIEQLAQYRFIRIDAKSDSRITDFNGRSISVKDWVAELNMAYRPGLIFFDQGREINRIESMLYPYHFEQVLRFGLNRNYEKFPDYSSFSRARRDALLAQGIDIDVGRPADW